MLIKFLLFVLSEPRSGARHYENESHLFRCTCSIERQVVYSTRLGNKGNMARSKVSDTSLEVVKDHSREWCIRKDNLKFSLLITGKIDVGKSSLVNALVGKIVAEEGHDKVHCTDKVTSCNACRH